MVTLVVLGGILVAALNRVRSGHVKFCVPRVLVAIIVMESIIMKGTYYLRNREMRKRVLDMYSQLLGISSHILDI